MSSHVRRRRGLIGMLAAGLVASPLAVGLPAAPASADVSTKIASFPYTQDWSDASLITVNDDWSRVPGVQGYTATSGAAAGSDPQLFVADTGTTDVFANMSATANNGGVLEVDGDTIAIQGSNNAPVPYVVFRLDLTGRTGTTFSFDARDLDASADDAVQPIAVQYRLGTTGSYTNLPAGFIADATTGGSATQVTHRDVRLPAVTDDHADVHVRVLTVNAVGNDELVGIDNIVIGGSDGPSPLAVTAPGPRTATVGQPITPFTLAATGGTAPYTWTADGLPAGLQLASTGTVSGTPTATGTSTVDVSVTDSATPAASASSSFTYTVTQAGAVTPIAAIQGTGATTPLDGQTVTTEGVVTAAFPSGGLNGFYLQTGGPDTTPEASDAIFVYGGTSGFGAATPEVGDSVRVTGTAGEFQTVTQLTATAAGISELATPLPAPVAKTTIPGADCALGSCQTVAQLDAAREAVEGMIFQPTDDFTVTDVYDGSPYTGGTASSAMFGEIGIAAHSDVPLATPTDVEDALDTAAIGRRTAYNNAHRIILDDGATTNFVSERNQPFPYFTPSHTVRVGAGVSFPEPVVLTHAFGAWRLQPQTRVTGAPEGIMFEQDRPAAPEAIAGDVKLATFNVLNYFPTLGSTVSGCQAYTDRNGQPTNTRSCSPDNGPRGAWDAANLARQQAKIVASINELDADVVTLQEIENSRSTRGANGNRDAAVSTLVAALNRAAGGTTPRWAFAASPTTLPPVAEEDVIRNAIIYDPSTVAPVGASQVLVGSAAFSNAREPFAQAFKKLGAADADGFAVIDNHFKSKGSGTDDGTGQGNANPDRKLQAQALVTFAESFATSRGVERVFLTGDFNAYSGEEPIQILEAAGYTDLVSTTDPAERSYNFDGQVGSLDHVLANEAAAAEVEGVDLWETNANESVYYEYSRHNYNVTNLHADDPFRASDHNPTIVGFTPGGYAPTSTEIQVLATNDFHGRLENNPSGTEAGAAVLAGAVKQLRAENENTVFAAAGDLIGASTFTSFILDDKPTIDALNEATLDVSAAGNHEFDQGYADLVDRVLAPESATNPEGGAEWEYIAANLRLRASGDPALEPSYVRTFDGVEVGFVGAVTEELPALVDPSGIADIEVLDIVDSVNAEADALKAEGVDVVVMLVHEGASDTSYATATSNATPFGQIVNGVNANVDAIVSGHTHLAYNHSVPVAAWADRPVKSRPVVSAGQYGSNLNQLVFTVDVASGDVTAATQELLPLKTGQTANYPADGATARIVSDAVAAATPIGNQPLGEIEAPFSRAKFANGSTENRGGESTLSNLVAEVQRWATEAPGSGGAQIAFMNPGGLRADLVGTLNGTQRELTYRQAADVQPFANTLVNMDLTGADIKEVLEQQWQRDAGGAVPSRPFLKLGTSEGFAYTYDPTAAEGSRITSMTLHGEPVVATSTYSVTVNSFLASGGDNFRAFTNGTGTRDTGKVDLQAMVDYMVELAADEPLPIDHGQRAVGVSFPSGSTVTAGESLELDLTSLIMTGTAGGVADVRDATVEISLDGAELGSFPVDATIPNPDAAGANGASTDESGTASGEVEIPADTAAGEHVLRVTGATTGTEVRVPVTVEAPALVVPTMTARATPARVVVKRSGNRLVAVVAAEGHVPTGTVELRYGSTVIGSAPLVETARGGVATIAVSSYPTVGTFPLTLAYLGDARTAPATAPTRVVVVKQTPRLSVNAPKKVGRKARPVVRVVATGVRAAVTGKVRIRYQGKDVVRTLRAGRTSLKLARLNRNTKVTVTYLGNGTFTAATKAVTIKVKRR